MHASCCCERRLTSAGTSTRTPSLVLGGRDRQAVRVLLRARQLKRVGILLLLTTAAHAKARGGGELAALAVQRLQPAGHPRQLARRTTASPRLGLLLQLLLRLAVQLAGAASTAACHALRHVGPGAAELLLRPWQPGSAAAAAAVAVPCTGSGNARKGRVVALSCCAQASAGRLLRPAAPWVLCAKLPHLPPRLVLQLLLCEGL